MKTYKVTITGQQIHIFGKTFEHRTLEQVNAIIENYWDTDYDLPQMDENKWELNVDTYIRIEEESTFSLPASVGLTALGIN